jgi:hypothetical protein
VVAITGPRLSRRAELVALWATAAAALVSVVIPMLYLVALPMACVAMAAAAPAGRRLPPTVAVWTVVSVGALVGGTI